MNKVAIIVQRCHESVVGGSEALAWQYATLLKDSYEVDILTTTATDAAYWTNVLSEGLEIQDGINIRRFHVDIGYSPFRTELFTRMLGDFERFHLGKVRESTGKRQPLPWSLALQQELVRRIGPYSASLVSYLRNHWFEYRAIIVVTYLYPTALFSLLEIPKGRALFAPTLHDEQPAYLSVFQHAARRAHSMIWLTEAEQRLGTALWGELPGRVVAMAIDTEPRQPAQLNFPCLLYCGRIDPNKGCAKMFDYFIRFKLEHPSSLRLVLSGKDDIPIPNHPDIDFRGFVSAEEKFRLMAGAEVYLMPSGKESFSIVALEAMAQQTPVLVNAESAVLVDHIEVSGGGRIFHNYESFRAQLSDMLSDAPLRKLIGKKGREYVVRRYGPERVREALIEAVESCPMPAATVAGIPSLPGDLFADPNSGRSFSNELTLEDLSKSPPLPLPEGWSEPRLRQLIGSVRVEDAPVDELKIYVDADFKRFVYTLGLVPEKSGQRILELGANPYFTTTLLQKFRKAELYLANFFDGSEPQGKQRATIGETGEVVEHAYQQFNIEADRFPYDDDFFDVVLFCEIIEHLLSDPVHALSEIKRILKPGGILVLTTPNATRLDNVRKVIAGENVYDPYSGYGPYGRHNREYIPEDLFGLLSSNGFTVRTIFTADVHPGHTSSSISLSSIAPLVKDRSTALGQYIFCQCSLDAQAKTRGAVRPDWLYRSRVKPSPAPQQTTASQRPKPEQPTSSRPPKPRPPQRATVEVAYPRSAAEFQARFEANLRDCAWEPHSIYNVFTQYDKEYYLDKKEAFLHKYRCFYALSQTINPRKIIEMGTSAGSSGDAYLSASPRADYVGFDSFGIARYADGSVWDPYAIAQKLFTDRSFRKWRLVRIDLRTIDTLSEHADLVIVDAGHEFENQYGDLKLSLSANPKFIFVDDADDPHGGRAAIEQFIHEDLAGLVDFTYKINYFGGGLVIKLNLGNR